MLSTDLVEAEAPFDARRLACLALLQLGRTVLTEDVCLPRVELAEMVRRVERWGSSRVETAWRSGTVLGRAVAARLCAHRS